MALDEAASRQYHVENTFLYVDEVGALPGLCLAAPPAPEPCPLGFSGGEPTVDCALSARANGIYRLEGEPYAVTLDAEGRIECWVEGGRLFRHGWGHYAGCAACLDAPLAGGTDPVARKWRGVAAWSGLALSGYGFSLPGPRFRPLL